MRVFPLVALSLALVAGCSVQQANTADGKAGSGQAGSAGSSQAGSAGSEQAGSGGEGQAGSGAGQAGSESGGSGGSAGSGTAGAGGDPCNGVPAEGRCVDDHTYERCLVGSPPAKGQPADPPKVSTGTCAEGTTCKTQDGWSGCVPTAACSEGSSYCDTSTSRKVCNGGQWVAEACGGSQICGTGHNGGVECVDPSNQAGQVFTIKGHLSYEARTPITTGSNPGYSDPAPSNAQSIIVLAYDGNDYIGGGYTDADGNFALDASQKPSAATTLWFLPMLYEEGNTPQLAVAHADKNHTGLFDLQASEAGYWSFSRTTGESLDAGDILITEAEGSPAIHIHQWMVYSLFVMRQSLPDAKPFNVLALWEPNVQFSDCGHGSCYAPRGYGSKVKYDKDASDFYEGTVLLAGVDETPHQHSASVILHEFGHYSTEAFSISPHEAAQHSLSMAAPPGMAWSEGVATYLGQSIKQDSLYFDKQTGITWWYNVDQPYYAAPKLEPGGGMDQNIGESVVTHMLWHLDDGATESWDKSSLGQDALLKAFGSKRTTTISLNRGYKTVDLVDFLDALRCAGATSEAVLSVTGNEGFPYDDNPTCP